VTANCVTPACSAWFELITYVDHASVLPSALSRETKPLDGLLFQSGTIGLGWKLAAVVGKSDEVVWPAT